ncbi:MAG: scavenger receptor cysteine-rich domain-containing protein, partial [Myxococcales bacterium]|nr:scavenger receptor cysteine-rich domain-containing protein [Myxococcales bacterium]
LWLVETDWQDPDPGFGAPALQLMQAMIYDDDQGTVRLAGGDGAGHGRVEIYANDQWGTVCDDAFGLEEAEVVCRQLGFAGALESIQLFGGGADPIWLDDLACVGDEPSLLECPARPLGQHNCGHIEDAGVRCATEGACRIDGHCPEGQVCQGGQCGQQASCLNNPQWRPVECVTGEWVWTNDRSFPTLEEAAANRTLYSGCTHAGDNDDGLCSLDGTGWVSTETFVMQGCNETWRHIGGSFSGNCGGHDGDTVRLLVLGDNDCYDYQAQ